MIKPAHLAALAVLLAAPALGQTLADGPAIAQAINGNTVQGSMLASGGYTEFYAPDGTIKGKDYTGTWRVQDDTMCFKYGADPESCWAVALDGDQVTWLKDGKADGTGSILPGNPNGY